MSNEHAPSILHSSDSMHGFAMNGEKKSLAQDMHGNKGNYMGSDNKNPFNGQ